MYADKSVFAKMTSSVVVWCTGFEKCTVGPSVWFIWIHFLSKPVSGAFKHRQLPTRNSSKHKSLEVSDALLRYDRGVLAFRIIVSIIIILINKTHLWNPEKQQDDITTSAARFGETVMLQLLLTNTAFCDSVADERSELGVCFLICICFHLFYMWSCDHTKHVPYSLNAACLVNVENEQTAQ